MIGAVKCFQSDQLQAWARKIVVFGNTLSISDIRTVGVVIGRSDRRLWWVSIRIMCKVLPGVLSGHRAVTVHSRGDTTDYADL